MEGFHVCYANDEVVTRITLKKVGRIIISYLGTYEIGELIMDKVNKILATHPNYTICFRECENTKDILPLLDGCERRVRLSFSDIIECFDTLKEKNHQVECIEWMNEYSYDYLDAINSLNIHKIKLHVSCNGMQEIVDKLVHVDKIKKIDIIPTANILFKNKLTLHTLQISCFPFDTQTYMLERMFDQIKSVRKLVILNSSLIEHIPPNFAKIIVSRMMLHDLNILKFFDLVTDNLHLTIYCDLIHSPVYDSLVECVRNSQIPTIQIILYPIIRVHDELDPIKNELKSLIDSRDIRFRRTKLASRS